MNTLTVNQKVYLGRFNGHDWLYSIATITRVTPSGAFSAQFEGAEPTCEPTRFTKDGKEIGATYRGWELDTRVSFETRAAAIAKCICLKAAANAVRSIEVSSGVNDRWGKDGLLAEVVRLEALLADARAKVEAI